MPPFYFLYIFLKTFSRLVYILKRSAVYWPSYYAGFKFNLTKNAICYLMVGEHNHYEETYPRGTFKKYLTIPCVVWKLLLEYFKRKMESINKMLREYFCSFIKAYPSQPTCEPVIRASQDTTSFKLIKIGENGLKNRTQKLGLASRFHFF